VQALLTVLHVVATSNIFSEILSSLPRAFLVCVLIVALHEAGHLVSAWFLGVHVKNIGISWKGPYIRREAGPLGKNLAITLSGPMLNLICAGLWHWFPVFGLYSLVLAVSNLLPIKGSDGRRAFMYVGTLLRAQVKARNRQILEVAP
jgi:membrane-associated protease RseP (regulator of RpoE activity)